MADEFGTQHPKNVSTVKPSGSLSKIMDTTEGLHKPLGKYMFNNINFGNTNPIVQKAIDAGYRVFQNPDTPENTLITMPVCWDNVEFDKVVKEDGSVVEVNLDSAVKQLERYKFIQTNWTDQNTSNTISYSPDEVPEIIDWLLANWDCYVGVSFLYRNDPSKTAQDLGYQYLPQEVVTKEVYEEYVKQLKPLVLDEDEETVLEALDDSECAGGACPIR
jgi:ribonucleoside-triphosphate reductase